MTLRIRETGPSDLQSHATSAHRGKGIGAALMAHIEADARERGAARIQLTSNRARTRAHVFYERLGYEASHVGMKKYL